MGKYGNVIFMKQEKYTLSKSFSTLKHMLVIGNIKSFEKNNKNFNRENVKWNMYATSEGIRKDNELVFQRAKEKLISQVQALKYEHEFKNFGHNIWDLEKLKNIIEWNNKNLFENNKELLKVLNDVETHKQLKKLLNSNTDIKFNYYNGKKITYRVSWDEYVNGVGVKYDPILQSYVKYIKKDKYNKINAPKFTTNFQVHASREWFEQMGWVEYQKANKLVLDEASGKLIYSDVNETIKKMNLPKEVERWFLENIKLFKKTMRSVTYDNSHENLLAVSLHAHETKLHIDFLVSNIWKRPYYYEKVPLLKDGENVLDGNGDQKFKHIPIEYEKAQERIAMGDDKNIVLKEKLGLITSFRDKLLAPLLNTQIYNTPLHKMHEKKFDANIKHSGHTKNEAKKEGIEINYDSMDKYRDDDEKKSIKLFGRGESLSSVLKNLDSKQKEESARNRFQQKQIENFKDITQEIYKAFSEDKNADTSKLEKRLFTEAGMGNFTQIERLKNNIKEEVEKDKASYKEKEKA